MKIALVHRRFTTNGGTERYLVGFARFLVSAGHDVSVLCNEIREDLRNEPGVRFVHLAMVRPAKLLSLWNSAANAVQSGEYEAVMGFGRTPGHHLFRAGGGSHVAYLRRAHPMRRFWNPPDWLESHLDRSAVRQAKICIANSKLGSKGLRDDYGAARVEVVYNGVDLARFCPDRAAGLALRQSLGNPARLAIFVGNGFERKGLATAIAALPSDWTLWVVGNDPPVPASENVRFLGGQRDPERFLQAADVLMLPTQYDPFANVCLEAMACGVAALTTPHNGASEIAPEPWMVCNNAGEFNAALSERSAQEWRILGDQARAVAEGFTRPASYARALELLQEASG